MREDNFNKIVNKPLQKAMKDQQEASMYYMKEEITYWIVGVCYITSIVGSSLFSCHPPLYMQATKDQSYVKLQDRCVFE